jgi:glutamate-1-semialdehyde 2,1-aminomutase
MSEHVDVGRRAREELRLRVETEFRERTTASGDYSKRATAVLPCGISGDAKYYEPYPVVLERASGGHVWDVDGTDYVDLLMGAGPCLLGHGHPKVVERVEAQLRQIVQTLAPTTLEAEYADRLRGHMPYLERIRFANTGSEAVRTCLRAARAVTGRTGVAKLEGGFHGSDDPFLLSTGTVAGPPDRPRGAPESAGIPAYVADDVLILPSTDPDAAIALIEERADRLAAVAVEPVAFSTGGAVALDPVFARALRNVTEDNGIVLIFDEVVTCFRMGLGGAPDYLGVRPDLSALGKALGGGFPLAAFGGGADIMEQVLGPGAQADRIFQSGTFTGHPIGLTAGMATLDVLESEPVLETVNRLADRLRDGLRDVFSRSELPASVTGTASVFQLHMTEDPPRGRRDIGASDLDLLRLFLLAMVARGVLWPPIHPGVTAYLHDGGDMDRVVAVAAEVAEMFLAFQE